jgi:hypothetical protein
VHPLARYLSAAEGVHCSLELFSPGTDHRLLVPPECFHTLARGEIPRGHRKARPGLLRFTTQELARRGEALRFFGNKTPNYIFRLPGLLDEVAPGRLAVCWRDVRSVALSYARRADDPDDSWDPGKRALFAVSDTMTCLRALADLGARDAIIVPNRAVVADWEGATRAALGYLLPDLGAPRFDPVNLAAIEERLAQSHGSPRAAPELVSAETAAIAAFEAIGADAVLNRDRPFLLSEVRADVARLAAALPEDPVTWLRRYVREDARTVTRQFWRRWQETLGRRAGDGARPRRERPDRPRNPARERT